MKKSLIVSCNSKHIDTLPKSFLGYIPKENNFEKIATHGNTEYDYIYITNFMEKELDNFSKLFSNNEEEFFVDGSSYEASTIENLYVAFNNANYSYKIDKNFEASTATLSFLNENNSVKRAKIIAKAINKCKNLINEPSNYLTTNTFTLKLEKLATKYNLDYNVYYKKQLEEAGAGGILAVNKGSKEDARIVQLQYNGADSEERPYVLVGKGIVFDTGGYSLKSTTTIQHMKSDMGGAAVVASVIAAIAQLKLPINVIALIPITDNLISADSYRPDDIITFMNGLTTEIISTDAEGRLILADALVYATQHNPELIIDIATLTGAIVNALGHKTTGVFGNNQNYIDKLINRGLVVNEYIWHMPINEYHREQIKGKIATLRNSASPAGSCTAAAFLENFVEDYNWMHIDIAGTSYDDKTGATGATIRPLIEFFSTIKE